MNPQEQIDRIKANVAETYSVLEAAGATMPGARNSDNLPATAASLPAPAAYITESGMLGVYNYRKWSDGTKECWYRGTVTRAISASSSASGIVVSTAAIYGSYPTGLFSEPPTCQLELQGITSGSTEYNGWLYTVASGTAARTPQKQVARIGTAISSATVAFSIYAIGK
jgi:hypothetical protein